MTSATYQDATLLVQLAQWAATLDLPAASAWLHSDKFVSDPVEFEQRYPADSSEMRMVSKLMGFYECVGALHKHGLINEALLFDWLWAAGVWNMLKGFALAWRQASGNPRLYECFEALAQANVAHDAQPGR